MGAGASALLPADCTKDDARAFAGERWNASLDAKFDEVCRDNKVSKDVVLQHEHSEGLRIRDWSRIAESAHQLTEAAVKEAPPVLDVDVETLTGNEAATKLQGATRKTAAYNDCKIKVAKRINTSLEMASERKQNKLDAFMAKLTEQMDALEEQTQSKDTLLDTIDTMRKTGWPRNIDQGDHPGITLPDPLTKDAMCELMERLNEQARKETKKKKARNGIKDILHAKYALQIAVGYMDAVRKLPSVVHVNTQQSGKLTVVGDLHGQLRDLIHIFRYNGLPSFDNPYLFNGDLVDRGDYSVEIIILLMGFSVADPGSIYMNRGNHEDMTVCTGYGFVDELVNKFSQNTAGRHLLAIIDTIFSLLPLVHVIDETIAVVHGGISDKFDLETLKTINRRLYRTLTGLPQTITHQTDGKDAEGHNHKDWAILMDCLWSDPAPKGEKFHGETTCKPNDERGGGVLWSADFTKEWLSKHRLGCLVRSHECQDDGFSTTHEGRVLTLFSASNYYGEDEENDGAILVLSPLQDPPGKLLTYSTCYAKGGYEKLQTFQLAGKMESAALARVEVCLLEHRRELVAAIKAKDEHKTGQLKKTEWAQIMNDILPVKLPWIHLADKFVFVGKNKSVVTYLPLTENLEAMFGSDDGAAGRENLFRNRDALVKLFRLLDADQSGSLDRAEFVKGCDMINSLSEGEPLFKTSDVDAFMEALDVNKDGAISFAEFSDGLLNHGGMAANAVPVAEPMAVAEPAAEPAGE